MATVKNGAQVTDQNANTLSGVQVDTALIGSAGVVIAKGYTGGMYVVAGTQTSSLSPVILSLQNAFPGDRITVKKYTTAVIGTGASQVVVVSGSAAGAVVGAFQIGTAAPNQVDAVFDGVQWR
jgi:hypothetical protein